jgi:ankyrin repeat protein
MKSLSEILQDYQDTVPEFEGIRLVSVNQKGRMGDTPLHVAIWRRSTEDMIVLLANGADPNIPGEKQIRPLEIAVEYVKNKEIAALLIRHGAV